MSELEVERAPQPLERPRRVLVVDDDETLRERLVRALARRGFEVSEGEDHESGLAAARSARPDYAVIDLRLPGSSGLELVRALRDLDCTTRIVVLTGYGSIATAVEAVHCGAQDYMTKPADADQIVEALLGKRPNDPLEEEVEPERDTPTLARVEWEHIQRVLAECDGNISRAARVLGIHRRSLQRKLAKYPPRR